MISFQKYLLVFSLLPVFNCQECGHINITPPTFTFSSPTNNKGLYRNNLECSWRISVENSSRIHIRFTKFQFEEGFFGNCYDFLQMWDGGNEDSKRVFISCAETLQEFKEEYGETASFNSSGNEFFLRMNTDGSDRRRGFSATYRLIPELITTTQTTVSTSPDVQNPKHTTKEKSSSPEAKFTPSNLRNNIPTNLPTTDPQNFRATSHRNHSDIPYLETTLPSHSTFSSQTVIVVVTSVSSMLIFLCLSVIGFFAYAKRPRGKSSATPNDCFPVGTAKEQHGPNGTLAYYMNESFNASPQSLCPPPYESISDTHSSIPREIKTDLDEGYIANAVYESYEEEGQGNVDDLKNEDVSDTAYENFDPEGDAESGNAVANAEEVSNIVYESYDREGVKANGDYVANEGEVSNIAYESYDSQNKLSCDCDAIDVDVTYQMIDECQSANDDCDRIHSESEERLEDNIIYEPYDNEE